MIRPISLLSLLLLLGCETREEKLDRLIQEFRQGKDDERERAAFALGTICYQLGDTPKVQQAVALLVKGLTDPNASIRSSSALALGDIGTPAQGTLKELAKRLDDENDRVRCNAAGAICQIVHVAQAPVPGHKEVVPNLVKALQDSDQYVRGHAVRALSTISPRDKDVLRAIAPLAKDKEVGVRCDVAGAFASAGPAAEPFIDTVNMLLTDESETVRQKATRALEQIKKGKQ
jgi:HEAT repeat protein